jgi:bifunctional ADP-heptose synthase (sugar kinase/adenylyltransferase)
MLYEASKLGDILVVGVDHDESARKLKGPKRPINDHDLRMKLLTLLEPVDFVFLIPNIEYIKPDVFYVSKVYEELKPNIIASCVSSDDKGGLLRKRQSGAVGAEFVNIKHPFSGMSTTKLMEAFGFD